MPLSVILEIFELSLVFVRNETNWSLERQSGYLYFEAAAYKPSTAEVAKKTRFATN